MISKIIAIENYTLELHLNDGSIRYFDVKPYLDYPAFSNLKNKDYFQNRPNKQSPRPKDLSLAEVDTPA